MQMFLLQGFYHIVCVSFAFNVSVLLVVPDRVFSMSMTPNLLCLISDKLLLLLLLLLLTKHIDTCKNESKNEAEHKPLHESLKHLFMYSTVHLSSHALNPIG